MNIYFKTILIMTYNKLACIMKLVCTHQFTVTMRPHLLKNNDSMLNASIMSIAALILHYSASPFGQCVAVCYKFMAVLLRVHASASTCQCFWMWLWKWLGCFMEISTPVGELLYAPSCFLSIAWFQGHFIVGRKKCLQKAGNHLSVWNFRQCWETELNKILHLFSVQNGMIAILWASRQP